MGWFAISGRGASTTFDVGSGVFAAGDGRNTPLRQVATAGGAAAIAAFDGDAGLGIHERISSALVKATEAVDSGAATNLLTRWVTISQELAKS